MKFLLLLATVLLTACVDYATMPIPPEALEEGFGACNNNDGVKSFRTTDGFHGVFDMEVRCNNEVRYEYSYATEAAPIYAQEN